jgi:hypothetical protein
MQRLEARRMMCRRPAGQLIYRTRKSGMKIIRLTNIERKEVPIYYRRLYTGIAEFEILNKIEERTLDFTIETKPTGAKEVFVTMPDPVDYPLVPLMKELKKFIIDMDDDGKLPPV